MKRIICFALLFCCLQFVFAEEMTKVLAVWSKDGTKVAYALSEKPKITFANDSLLIATPNVEVRYQLSQMLRFTYEELDITDIVDTKGNSVNPFVMNDDELLFPAIGKDRYVYIYTADGRTVANRTIKSGTTLSISLANYSNGIYVVNVNGLTYKIMKK